MQQNMIILMLYNTVAFIMFDITFFDINLSFLFSVALPMDVRETMNVMEELQSNQYRIL
jgi:hypothetical protein